MSKLSDVYFKLLTNDLSIPEMRAIDLSYPQINLQQATKEYVNLLRLQKLETWCIEWQLVSIFIKRAVLTQTIEEGVLTINGKDLDLLKGLASQACVEWVAEANWKIEGLALEIHVVFISQLLRRLIGVQVYQDSIVVTELPDLIAKSQNRLSMHLGSEDSSLFCLLAEQVTSGTSKND